MTQTQPRVTMSGADTMRFVMADKPRANEMHMCEMCETMISAQFDFCGFCAQETGFSTYPAIRPAIGSPAICHHGHAGIVTRVYTYSRDIEMSVDESHADLYMLTFCHTTN